MENRFFCVIRGRIFGDFNFNLIYGTPPYVLVKFPDKKFESICAAKGKHFGRE